MSADGMRATLVVLGAPASLAAFDAELASSAAHAEVEVSAGSASETLVSIGLMDARLALNCQAKLARITALSDAVFGEVSRDAVSMSMSMSMSLPRRLLCQQCITVL